MENSDRGVTEQSWMFERFLTQSDSLAGRGLSQLRLFEFTQEVHRISKNITPPGKNFFKTSQELRKLSRSLSDCKSILLNVMIQVSQFIRNGQFGH